MNTCLEHDFSQVATVHVFRKAYTDIAMPIYCNEPRIPSVSSDYGYSYKLKYDRDSIKCMDKQQRSVGAYVHTVTLSWEQDAATEDDYEMLLALRKYPHEVLITYFGGQRRFVRTDATAYAFDCDVDNGTCKCQLTLVSGQGLCLVDTITQPTVVDLSESAWRDYMILVADKTWNDSAACKHVCASVVGYSKVEVSTVRTTYVSFVSDYERPTGSWKSANVIGDVHAVSSNTTLYIPSGAKYVVIDIKASTEDYRPERVVLK